MHQKVPNLLSAEAARLHPYVALLSAPPPPRPRLAFSRRQFHFPSLAGIISAGSRIATDSGSEDLEDDPTDPASKAPAPQQSFPPADAATYTFQIGAAHASAAATGELGGAEYMSVCAGVN